MSRFGCCSPSRRLVSNSSTLPTSGLLHLSLFPSVKVSFKLHRSAAQCRTSIIPVRTCIARNRVPHAIPRSLQADGLGPSAPARTLSSCNLLPQQSSAILAAALSLSALALHAAQATPAAPATPAKMDRQPDGLILHLDSGDLRIQLLSDTVVRVAFANPPASSAAPRIDVVPHPLLHHRLEARRMADGLRPHHRQAASHRRPQLRRRLVHRRRGPSHPLRGRRQPHAGARIRPGRRDIPHPATLEGAARRIPLRPRPDAARHHRHQGIRPRPLAAQHQHRRSLPRLLARLRHPVGQHLLHPLRRSTPLRRHPARQPLRRRRQARRPHPRAHRRLRSRPARPPTSASTCAAIVPLAEAVPRRSRRSAGRAPSSPPSPATTSFRPTPTAAFRSGSTAN